MWNILNNSYKKIAYNYSLLNFIKYELVYTSNIIKSAAKDQKQVVWEYVYDLGKESLENKKINYSNISYFEIFKEAFDSINGVLNELNNYNQTVFKKIESKK